MGSYCMACRRRRGYSVFGCRLGLAAVPLYGSCEPTATLCMTTSAEEILEFWFGEPAVDSAAVAVLMKRWFSSDRGLDALIRDRFAPAMTAAAASLLHSWQGRPRGRLALILLLDQFPRNVYRGTAAAFAQDAKALDLTTGGIAAALDRDLRPLERLFFYMPMQHAESISVQDRSVELFDELARGAETDFLAKALASSADHARQHRDIIAEFGRFPHRNALLGRSSSEAEVRYLERGGATFGQKDHPERVSNNGRPGDNLNA